MIEVTNEISIPEDELRFTASLSSGPGGQNVNKVNTRVTLWFDVVNSPSLSPEQKELIASRLLSRISKDGLLRVISQQTRRTFCEALHTQRSRRLPLGASHNPIRCAAARTANPCGRKSTRRNFPRNRRATISDSSTNCRAPSGRSTSRSSTSRACRTASCGRSCGPTASRSSACGTSWA